MANYCSVTVETREREPTDKTPLEQYTPRGYARGETAESLALDAATALTASRWGPPFGTHYTEADGEWWTEAYECAARGVENAIVDALTGGGGE